MQTVITIDIDWAPDRVLAHTLELFSRAGVPCTLFATHATPLLQGLDSGQFETGIHPNFNSLLDGDNHTPEQIINPLREAFPAAKGIRSHSSLVSNVLVGLFGNMGFEYESNVCLPYSKKLELLPLWNGMTRVPFNWEDYLHFSFGKSFSATGLDLSKGLNILNFHPVHIYLNSESRERYESARPFYQQPDALIKYRNQGAGAATLLHSVLEMDLNFLTLEDLVNENKT
jgi:hypothetical protein